MTMPVLEDKILCKALIETLDDLISIARNEGHQDFKIIERAHFLCGVLEQGSN